MLKEKTDFLQSKLKQLLVVCFVDVGVAYRFPSKKKNYHTGCNPFWRFKPKNENLSIIS